ATGQDRILKDRQGFSVLRIEGPHFVERGHAYSLTCVYDMGRCHLFNVEWLFNDENFFSFSPVHGGHSKDKAPIIVDLDQSNSTTVVIPTARFRDSGTYKCTVTTQEEEYYIDNKTFDLTVGVLPTAGPTIKETAADPDGGTTPPPPQVGSEVSLECTSQPSYPATNLTWVMNRKVGHEPQGGSRTARWVTNRKVGHEPQGGSGTARWVEPQG
ncbi:uncharacterized protein LOC125178324, partial [Hyalella azteca]|uniref:Uncharacterized protein LOC125178324 n=1 Tax=Hyalella azteca TaxID=294128 RepID=A0A979FM71_HYAAZ